MNPLQSLRADLHAAADPAKSTVLGGFFKTAPGGYAADDQFLGITVPRQRQIMRAYRDLPLADIATLLASPIHEERLTALLILVDQSDRAQKAHDTAAQDQIAEFYLLHKDGVNNWDLVDASSRDVLGPYYARHDPAPLIALADSPSLWDRRIAIVTTYYFIRQGQFELTFQIADRLLHDGQDLIRKAVGWMLREAGNRNPAAEIAFLAPRYKTMPRTMLRYAIEKFPPAQRAAYLKGEI